MDDTIEKIIQEQVQYAGIAKEIEYLCPEQIQKVSTKRKLFLNSKVNRSKTVYELANILLNINLALNIEASIYESTLLYCFNECLVTNLIPATYNDKMYSILYDLNPSVNKYLTTELGVSINPQQVGFLTPTEINPQHWEYLMKKAETKERKRKEIATSNAYTCPRCKEKKCQVIDLQTRSLDEPITRYITCLHCYHRFKK